MVDMVAEPSDRRPRGPLTGIRILALEQMQATPLRHAAAGPPGRRRGEGRTARAASWAGPRSLRCPTPEGRGLGATFLRNNLGKQSICIDLKNPRGRQLVLDMAPRFDVVAENFRAGTMERLGLGFEDLVAAHPTLRLRVGLGFRQRDHVPLPGSPRLRTDRRGDVGHLRDEAARGPPADRSPRSAAWATSVRRCSPRVGILAALARTRPDRAAHSSWTWPCSTR